jgi:hypothetical protein
MGVAAELALQPRVPGGAEISSHELYGAAKKGEGRDAHPLELFRNQLENVVFAGGADDIHGIKVSRRDPGELSPPQMAACRQAAFLSVFAGIQTQPPQKANRRKSPGPLRRRFLILLASIRQSGWEIKKEGGLKGKF